MTDTLRQNDDDMLAAEYVLGNLPDSERKAFALRLSADANLRKQVQFWESHFASFNADYAEANPPPALRGAVHDRLFGAEENKGFLHSLGFWRGLSFATLAALVFTFAMPYFTMPAPQITSVAELASQQGKGVQLAAYFDASKKLIRYARVSDAPAEGRDFELWVIIGKDAPVSLGVVPPDSSGVIKVSAELAAKMIDATLAISDEPKGGSLTGQPSGAVLSVGKLTRV